MLDQHGANAVFKKSAVISRNGFRPSELSAAATENPANNREAVFIHDMAEGRKEGGTGGVIIIAQFQLH